MLSNWLTRKRNTYYLGIDVGTSAIKLVLLGQNKKAISFIYCDYISLLQKKSAEIRKVIQTALNKLPQCKYKIALALPDSEVMSKIIQLDSAFTVEEIENHILLEAGNYIPYPINEVCFDFQIVEEEQRTHRDILLVAARKDKINTYLNYFSEHQVSKVGIQSYNQEYFFSHFQQISFPYTTWAVIDIGSSSTSYVIFHHGKVIFVRTEDLSCDEWVSLGEQKFRDKIKINSKNIFQRFRTNFDYEIQHVFIIGGGSLIRNMAFEIKKHTNTDASVLNPLDFFVGETGLAIKNNQHLGSLFLHSCSLALGLLQKVDVNEYV